MNKVCQVLFLKAAPSSSPPTAVCITSLISQLMPSSHLSLKWNSWTFAPMTSNSTHSEQQTCRKSNQLCGLSMFCFIDPLVLALRPSGMLPLQYCFSNITFHNWQFHLEQKLSSYSGIPGQAWPKHAHLYLHMQLQIDPSLTCLSRASSVAWPCASVPFSDANFVDVFGGGTFL